MSFHRSTYLLPFLPTSLPSPILPSLSMRVWKRAWIHIGVGRADFRPLRDKRDGDKFWAACKLCRDTISTHLPGSGRSRKQYADQDDRDASFLNHAAKVLDDRELAVDQALSAFFAARDTTTAALGWMVSFTCCLLACVLFPGLGG